MANIQKYTLYSWVQFGHYTKIYIIQLGPVWPSALALVKLKGFAATALFFPLFAFFLFFTRRATVAVKIKGDKSIGHWTEVPGWSDTVFIPSVNNQEKRMKKDAPRPTSTPQQIRSK